MQRIQIRGERHVAGGPGRFLLGDVQALCPMLEADYAGRIKLIYLDPPFGTGDTFTMRVGKQNVRVPVYTDTLSPPDYLTLMRTVLTACARMLAPDGSIYVHIDHRKAAQMRLLMDDILGESNFVNEIVWAYKSGGRSTRYFARKHDTILFYRKSARHYFNIQAIGIKRGPERRNHMKRGVDEDGRVYYSIHSGGKTYKYHEDAPIFPSDVWTDIEHLHQRDPERTGYATQKPEALLRRIVLASSAPGDIVMDLFSGSGTTAAVAAQTGRQWVSADASPLALHTLRRRLLYAYANVSLLDEARAMTLCYELNDMPVPPVRSLESAGQKVAAPETDAALRYIAAGRAEEGIFLPRIHAFDPTVPLPLLASDTVLQLVDAYGKQGFFTL